MSFKDEVAAQHIRAGGKSKYDEIRESLSPDDWVDFKELLADRNVSGAAIARALRARGLEIAMSTIVTWRRDGRGK